MACHRWMTMPGNVRGSLIILIASLVAAVMSAFIKQVGQTIPVVEILFIRQILVVAIISPVIIRNIDRVFATKVLRYQFLRGLLSVFAMFTGFTAIVHLPLAEVTAISFIRTLFTTILAIVFLKEIVGVRRWTGVVIGFIGVLVIVQPDSENINVYAVFAIASAFFASGISIVMRKLSQIDNATTIMAYQSIFVTLGLGGPAIFYWVTPTYEEMGFIFIIGVLMSVLQRLYIMAFKAGEAAAIAPMEYARLVFATIIGILFFSEIPTVWTLAGAGIIIGSTLYTMHRTAVKKQASQQDLSAPDFDVAPGTSEAPRPSASGTDQR